MSQPFKLSPPLRISFYIHIAICGFIVEPATEYSVPKEQEQEQQKQLSLSTSFSSLYHPLQKLPSSVTGFSFDRHNLKNNSI